MPGSLPTPCLSAQRSLPALRQLTPDSAAFIQQSQQQQPPAPQATTALTAVVLSSSVQRSAGKTAATVTSALQPPVISLTQPTQVGAGKQAAAPRPARPPASAQGGLRDGPGRGSGGQLRGRHGHSSVGAGRGVPGLRGHGVR